MSTRQHVDQLSKKDNKLCSQEQKRHESFSIIIHPEISTEEFIRYMSVWDNTNSATIEIDEINQGIMYRIFDLALPKLPHPFAEAVLDVFIEDERIHIPDDFIGQCIKNASIGLIWSIYYRENKPDWVRILCAKRLSEIT